MKRSKAVIIVTQKGSDPFWVKRVRPLLLLFMMFLIVFAPSLAFAGKGSIKLRVVAVNPSKERPQVVPIKIYMPKEVIPDDIVKMEKELKVGYDSDKGVYYAYSEGVQLAPQETRVFEVQLEDVWKVRNQEIDKVKDETARALKHLENTEHFSRAKVIVDSINKRLNEIQVKQEDESISREEHIGAYRVNLLVMNQIKEDITLLEKMLQHTGAPPSVEFLRDTVFEKKNNIDRITAWKLILAIIGFLGLLGIGFYIRWFVQIKTQRLTQPGKPKKPSLKVGEQVEEIKGPRPVETEEEVEEVDIEKLMEPEDKEKREAG